MKIIDNNGRLFGKLSVIDALVILVVLVMAAALSFKGQQTHTSTSVTNVPITYQITVYGARQYLVDAILEEDQLYDQDRTSGGALGRIQSIEVLPGTRQAEFYDGTVETVPVADSYNLVLTVNGSGLVSEGRYLLNRVYDLGVNSARNFYTPYAQFVGTVTSIG